MAIFRGLPVIRRVRSTTTPAYPGLAYPGVTNPGTEGEPMRAVDIADVIEWLRLPPNTDTDVLTDVCNAVDVWVNRLPCVVDGLADGEDWSYDIALGATMLAARFYRRRNSPSGIDTVTDAGAIYLPRRDADIDTLLRLNEYNMPATA
jgi:hypothetical protein